MTETAFVSSVITSMVLSFFAGYLWGKYLKIFKELGRAV